MKKRILILLMMLAIVFSTMACKVNEPEKTKAIDESAKSVEVATDENTQSVEEVANEMDATVSSETEISEDSTVSDSKLGSVVDGTYKNSFVGLEIKLTDEWTYFTQQDLLDDYDIASIDDLDEVDSIEIFYFENNTASLNGILEKKDPDLYTNAEEYIEFVGEIYADGSVSGPSETKEVNLNGKKLLLSTSLHETDYGNYYTDLYAVDIGDYILEITASYEAIEADQEVIRDILNNLKFK